MPDLHCPDQIDSWCRLLDSDPSAAEVRLAARGILRELKNQYIRAEQAERGLRNFEVALDQAQVIKDGLVSMLVRADADRDDYRDKLGTVEMLTFELEREADEAATRAEDPDGPAEVRELHRSGADWALRTSGRLRAALDGRQYYEL